jgi:integrase
MSKKKTRSTTSHIEWKEVQFLISSLERDKNYRLCLLVSCGVYTGLHISGLLQLKYSDLLDLESTLEVRHKSGKTTEIKVCQQLRELVQRVYDTLNLQERSCLIFLNRYGTKPIDRCYVNSQLKIIFKKYRIKTMGNVSSEILRKSLGIRVLEVNNYSNASLLQLSEYFGHANPSITMRYLGLRQKEVLGVYDSLSL